MGTVGAVILALIERKLRFSMLHRVAMETTKISTIVFIYTGGEAVEQIMTISPVANGVSLC